DRFSSGFELVKFDVDSNGVTGNIIGNSLLSGFSNGLQFAGGRLYSTGGRVVDAASASLAGTSQGTGGGSVTAFAVDAALHRIFYVSGGTSNVVLSAFDTDTFLPLGSVTLAGVNGA